MLINAAEHPAASLDADWYRRVRVPRPIYEELVGQRGWLHRIGIDAKAQNSPCTSVPVAIAARCLNVVLALAPAQIAMFANSPLEAGRVTGLKENRLTLWPRMFRGARYLGDDLLHRLPARPFRDLGDYFRWMFGGLTASRALPPGDACDYKNADVACLVGAPSLAEFLYAGAWSARNLNDGGSVRLAARSEHFVYSQFAQFLDARWRYRMPIVPALPALLRAWDRRAAWKRCSSRPARKATSRARAGRGICRCRLAELSRRCSRGQCADGGVGAAIGAVAQSARRRGPGEAMGLAALACVARSGHRFGVGRCAGALPLPTGRGGSRRRAGRRRAAMARLCALRGGNRRDRRGPHAALVAPGARHA